MLILALSPLFLGTVDPTAGMKWAASVGIARIEAKRTGRPVLAVYTPGGRGYWLVGMLMQPRIREATREFLTVSVDSPRDYRRLVPNAEPPPFAQLIFVGRDGKVAKRLSGMVRLTDLHDCFEQVYSFMGLNPTPASADDQARLATRLAMKGELDEAKRILAGPARLATPETRAEAFGALGDELRARGETEEAMVPLEVAVSLSQGTPQTTRWTVRLAMNRARVGDRAMAVQELLTCAKRPDLPESERIEVRDLAFRVGEMRNAPRRL